MTRLQREVWSSVHAWRALAVLQAEEAVKPLTELFSRIDAYDDDWVGKDLPKALGVLGQAEGRVPRAMGAGRRVLQPGRDRKAPPGGPG